MSFLHSLLIFIGNIHGSLYVVRRGSKKLQPPGQQKKQYNIVRWGADGLRGQHRTLHSSLLPEKLSTCSYCKVGPTAGLHALQRRQIFWLCCINRLQPSPYVYDSTILQNQRIFKLKFVIFICTLSVLWFTNCHENSKLHCSSVVQLSKGWVVSCKGKEDSGRKFGDDNSS